MSEDTGTIPSASPKKRRHMAFAFFILFLVAWGLLVYYYSSQGIVSILGGVRNGYITAFVAALLGGLSTFTSVPYTLIIFTLGAAGLHPLMLGISAGVGLTLGDTISYLLGYYGRNVVPTPLEQLLNRLYEWLNARTQRWAVPALLFIYGSLFPLSNDVIVVSFGLARYPFWRMIIPLGLGSIVFNTLIAWLGAHGAEVLNSFS